MVRAESAWGRSASWVPWAWAVGLWLLWASFLGPALLGSGAVLAQEPVAVPALRQRVTDLTATLTPGQLATLEQRLQAFSASTGAQIALLLVPSTGSEDIAQYSIRVAEAWHLGRAGVDDGVLVLLAKDDRRSRIEVGYGLEGALNDATAKRILTEVMAPWFKRGDFYGGLSAGLDRIEATIRGEPLPAPKPEVDGELAAQLVLPAVLLSLFSGYWLRRSLGPLPGGLVNGTGFGLLFWLLGLAPGLALGLGLVVLVMTLVIRNGGGGPGTQSTDETSSHFWDSDQGGGPSGGDLGGGGFSGGGGDFGGGGASGDW